MISFADLGTSTMSRKVIVAVASPASSFHSIFLYCSHVMCLPLTVTVADGATIASNASSKLLFVFAVIISRMCCSAQEPRVRMTGPDMIGCVGC